MFQAQLVPWPLNWQNYAEAWVSALERARALVSDAQATFAAANQSDPHAPKSVRGALTLLPQGRAPAGVAAGEQVGARGALAEARGEEGGAADLAGDDLLDLVGLEGDDLGAGRLGVGVGDPDHDAVVGGDGLDTLQGLDGGEIEGLLVLTVLDHLGEDALAEILQHGETGGRIADVHNLVTLSRFPIAGRREIRHALVPP